MVGLSLTLAGRLLGLLHRRRRYLAHRTPEGVGISIGAMLRAASMNFWRCVRVSSAVLAFAMQLLPMLSRRHAQAAVSHDIAAPYLADGTLCYNIPSEGDDRCGKTTQ